MTFKHSLGCCWYAHDTPWYVFPLVFPPYFGVKINEISGTYQGRSVFPLFSLKENQQPKNRLKLLIFIVDQPGLEPGTFRLWVCCSNQLSYKSNGIKQSFGCAKVRVLSRTTKCLSKNVAHYFLTRVAARLPVCHIVSLFTNKQSYYLATWWELTNFAINIKNSLYN